LLRTLPDGRDFSSGFEHPTPSQKRRLFNRRQRRPAVVFSGCYFECTAGVPSRFGMLCEWRSSANQRFTIRLFERRRIL